MRIDYDDKGAPRVVSDDPGDLVLLHSHESGEMPIGRAGDWGMVTAVSAGGAHVDIRIVWHSYPRSTTRWASRWDRPTAAGRWRTGLFLNSEVALYFPVRTSGSGNCTLFIV